MQEPSFQYVEIFSPTSHPADQEVLSTDKDIKH